MSTYQYERRFAHITQRMGRCLADNRNVSGSTLLHSKNSSVSQLWDIFHQVPIWLFIVELHLNSRRWFRKCAMSCRSVQHHGSIYRMRMKSFKNAPLHFCNDHSISQNWNSNRMKVLWTSFISSAEQIRLESLHETIPRDGTEGDVDSNTPKWWQRWRNCHFWIERINNRGVCGAGVC